MDDRWAKLADLSEEDVATITSLECLGLPVRKRGSSSKSRPFFSRKPRAKNVRKVCP